VAPWEQAVPVFHEVFRTSHAVLLKVDRARVCGLFPIA
jgi:hypothetical protein